MKLPFKIFDTSSKPRPYWHVDAKWVCALLLILALAATLPVVALHRLTTRDNATEIVAYTMAGLTSPQGLDSAEGLETVKARVVEKGSETVVLGGVEVVFTAEDVNTLSPRELRLKVFRAFAASVYDRGVRDLAESQGLDAEAVEKAERDAFLIKNLSADTHGQLGKVLAWMIVADVTLLAALAFFSWRFGRLASPGLVLTLVGLPGLLLWLAARQNPEVSGAARSEDVSNYAEAASSFASFIGPLVVPHFAGPYVFVLVSGVVLLALAAVGRIVYGVINRRSGKGEHEHKEPYGKDNPKK